ncbi:acyl transferase [Aridibaculum aurantiacum]|uniref:acyl transferase n=1 Tax=Aridibaculum aurantiacum TaxID=2810307 RepID=UPI001A956D78|nr:acyl transferase [Aridibaculum aurantiacum]
MIVTDIVNNIFSVTAQSFEAVALQVFQFQYSNNQVYKQWVDALGVHPKQVTQLKQVPFLPVSFFKTHQVVAGQFEPEAIFESSGTTTTINSKHYVKDIELYKRSFLEGFRMFYGDVKDWCIIGLLPSYLERQGSSLVVMVDELVKQSGHPRSGFYLYDYPQLKETLTQLESAGKRTMVIGVTFALLDLAEQFPMKLQHTIVMETGGMKGRREELIRPQVHEKLQEGLGVDKVHSEYGMTELLSQAYSKGNGIFKSVPWMKLLLRDEDDPLAIKGTGRGVVNVIDLANIYSCSFIATDDAGIIYDDGSFEIHGRTDTSDIRGCSLMVV